jgi:hypothetical protein
MPIANVRWTIVLDIYAFPWNLWADNAKRASGFDSLPAASSAT